jgi:hypothetical protein
MATKASRQAGWLAAGVGALALGAGIFLEEPSLIGAGTAGVIGGAAAGVGFEPAPSAAVGAVAGVAAGGIAAAAGVGADSKAVTRDPAGGGTRAPTTPMDSTTLAIIAAVVAAMVFL